MTLELLIHSIVRQTTILIAQFATSGGARALAQVADQVLLDLVHDLEREGVGWRSSSTCRARGSSAVQPSAASGEELRAARGQIAVGGWCSTSSCGAADRDSREDLVRFTRDVEPQVRGVLRDPGRQRLRGRGDRPRRSRGSSRRGAWSASKNVTRCSIARARSSSLWVRRLAGRGRSSTTTRLCVNASSAARLGEGGGSQGRVGGSTFTVDVWDGHPFSGRCLRATLRVCERSSASNERRWRASTPSTASRRA